MSLNALRAKCDTVREQLAFRIWLNTDQYVVKAIIDSVLEGISNEEIDQTLKNEKAFERIAIVCQVAARLQKV